MTGQRRRRCQPSPAEYVAYCVLITRLEHRLRDLERRAGYDERAAAALAEFDRLHPRPHGVIPGQARIVRVALVAQRAVAGDPEAQAQIARTERILAGTLKVTR